MTQRKFPWFTSPRKVRQKPGVDASNVSRHPLPLTLVSYLAKRIGIIQSNYSFIICVMYNDLYTLRCMCHRRPSPEGHTQQSGLGPLSQHFSPLISSQMMGLVTVAICVSIFCATLWLCAHVRRTLVHGLPDQLQISSKSGKKSAAFRLFTNTSDQPSTSSLITSQNTAIESKSRDSAKAEMQNCFLWTVWRSTKLH
jgi:hypothetical protein